MGRELRAARWTIWGGGDRAVILTVPSEAVNVVFFGGIVPPRF